MTEHTHDEQFCLACTLLEITPLLPHQGPIKDFIHQNTLQVFIDKPFPDAVEFASKLYGARPYMDLSFYRSKFANKEISDTLLNHAIEQQFNVSDQAGIDLIRHALFYFVEIADERTFDNLIKNSASKNQDAQALKNTYRHFSTTSKKASIKELLNEKLGQKIDHEVNAILFRLLGSYVDQGVSLWSALDEISDFQNSVLHLAEDSYLSVTRFVKNSDFVTYLSMPPDIGIKSLLKNLLASTDLYADYIKESLLDHLGWSGMINVIAKHPESLAKKRKITIRELLLVKLALEWQFIRNTDPNFLPITREELSLVTERISGVDSHVLSLAYWATKLPESLLLTSDQLAKKISLLNLQLTWHIAFEQTYYQSIADKFTRHKSPIQKEKKFQAIFCIDDRECSFRRHLEDQSSEVETFGFPGFFGIEFYFKPHKKDILEKMCPAPITPKHLVMEHAPDEKIGNEKKLLEFASFISRHGANSILFGLISAYTLGHLSAFRLLFSFLHPLKLLETKRLATEKETTALHFAQNPENKMHEELFLGFTPFEMATRVHTVLKSMGLVKDFAKVVFAIAHGSSSVNNPHFAAYDCGACSGRKGTINARLFALMANMPEVRDIIREKGIDIPDDTVFVGGIHDTCTDDVTFLDLDRLSTEQTKLLGEFTRHIERARELNALERCKRFQLVPKNISENVALLEVRHRAHALFEPRPELGHATNALCIVGRRARSYKMNFDRRAFLQSYDPTIDEKGQILAGIMAAVIPVCGGINLEYFFSRVDPAIYGCGTKLSHNVCSLLGVGNGLDDDLRTGLPIQMTEIHDPVRLLIVIEQTEEIIMDAIFSNQALAPWMKNDWIKIASLNPQADQLCLFDYRKGLFVKMNSFSEAQ